MHKTILGALLLCFGTVSGAAADPITVTAGSVFAYWDGSLTSVTLTGNGLSISSDAFAGSAGGFSSGTTADLNGGFTLYDEPPRSYSVTVNGTPYTAFLAGSGGFTTQPFTAPSTAPPPLPDGSLPSVNFSTPFTFTGSVRGYPTGDMTGATLFNVELVGSGTARADFLATGNTFFNRTGVGYTFSPAAPAPTPEPASILLLGSGALLLTIYSRKRRPLWDSMGTP